MQLHEEIAVLRQENLALHDELQEIPELRNENQALKGELLEMYRQVNALFALYGFGFGQGAWPPPASNPPKQRTQKGAKTWPKQRKKKLGPPSDTVRNGPFYGASLDSLEEVAEALDR